MYVLPRREARLREHNPCHEPGGKSTGGQFARKGSAGCAVQSTGEQPSLVDQKTGQAKFNPPPPVEKPTSVTLVSSSPSKCSQSAARSRSVGAP